MRRNEPLSSHHAFYRGSLQGGFGLQGGREWGGVVGGETRVRGLEKDGTKRWKCWKGGKEGFGKGVGK